MIKSRIPVPSTLTSSIPVPINNKKVDEEKKLKQPSKQNTQPCTVMQVKTKPSFFENKTNSTRIKTTAASGASKKPISNNSHHVPQTKPSTVTLKTKPSSSKPVSNSTAIKTSATRRTVDKVATAVKTKPQKAQNSVANQNFKMLKHTKQSESCVKVQPLQKPIKKLAVTTTNINNRKTVKEVSTTLKAKPQKAQTCVANLKLKMLKNTKQSESCVKQCENKVDQDTKKPQGFDTNFGVSDSEFLASDYFKSLILSEKELSPGILKTCSETKCSSNEVDFLTPADKFLGQYKSVDEFVEDVRRNSSKFAKKNGFAVVKKTPEKLILSKFNSVDDFVDDVRRNSARFFNRFGKSYNSPVMRYRINRNSPFVRRKLNCLSMKENLDCSSINVQRLSENKKSTISTSNSQWNFDPNQRRWTCNVLSNLNINQMNTCQIAEEIRRYSLIGKDSVCQQPMEASVLKNKNHYGTLSPYQKALRDIEVLRSKKKNKAKKKVTFLIPSKNSPELPFLSNKIHHKTVQSKLSNIAESDSQNSTPELEWNFCRSKSQCQESKTSAKDSASADTTPELNLPTHTSNRLHNDTETFKLDFHFQNKPSIFVSSVDEIDRKFESSERTSELKNDSINEIQLLKRLSITPLNEKNELSIEKKSKGFCVNDKKLFTPHPVAKYPQSDFSSVESLSFLPKKCIALNSLAPIDTPFVLRNMCNSSNTEISSVRQKLNFEEKLNLSDERRESQIIIQNIPTAQKFFDFMCDEECCILSSLSSTEIVIREKIRNPIATILNEGDEMHIVPISSP